MLTYKTHYQFQEDILKEQRPRSILPNQLQRSTFLISAFTALPGDKIYGSLERDARVANTNDTFTGAIVITGYQVIAYAWRA